MVNILTNSYLLLLSNKGSRFVRETEVALKFLSLWVLLFLMPAPPAFSQIAEMEQYNIV
jgi:hypothetical protein